MFEDEASFWLDGTMHRTWARIGVQPRVETCGLRRTAHVYGGVSVDKADFTCRLALRRQSESYHIMLESRYQDAWFSVAGSSVPGSRW